MTIIKTIHTQVLGVKNKQLSSEQSKTNISDNTDGHKRITVSTAGFKVSIFCSVSLVFGTFNLFGSWLSPGMSSHVVW
jgi:hypothetical protein